MSVVQLVLDAYVRPQLTPQGPARQTRAQLPRSFQAHALDEHLRDVGIVRWRGDLRGKQFQLVTFAGLVEHLDRLQPPPLRRVIQLTERTQRPLPRTIRPADRFY